MQIRDRIRELKRVKARDLRPNPKNWRTHPKAQREALQGVLAEIGFADALIARELEDGSLELIDGHLRAETAPEMEVPVLILDVTEEEADKLLATLDPLATMAGASAEQLEKLLSGMGSTNEAVAALLERTARGAGIDTTPTELDEDAIPAPPAEAVTRRGDLWTLGDHRLFCGDSALAEDVDSLMRGAPAHLVNTDPPYNVKVEPRSNNAFVAGETTFHPVPQDSGRAGQKVRATTKRMRAKDRPLANDCVSPEQFGRLLKAWFGNISRILIPGGGFYIWGGYANIANYPAVLKESGLYFSQALIWVKEHPVLTRKDFMGNHEWAFYGWKEGAAHRFFGPSNIADVWSVKKVNPQSMVHLTEKPVELARRAIEYSSKKGEQVLDLFGGSGSTLIAAQHTERRGRLIELDPLYCDVIIQRWQNLTGRHATLDGTDQTWRDVAGARKINLAGEA